jgi:hypothetical protein
MTTLEQTVLLEVAPKASELLLDTRYIERLAQCKPSGRWIPKIEEILQQNLNLLTPRWCARQLFPFEIEALWTDGEHPPIRKIATRGETWAFVATIGDGFELGIAQYTEQSQFLEALLLDAIGSAAVEALCDLAEMQIAASASSRKLSRRFSPGYCHWSLEAQTRLFALLEPAAIGVQLLFSSLMKPLKSVSGLVVLAEEDALRVDPKICANCKAIGCIRRNKEN